MPASKVCSGGDTGLGIVAVVPEPLNPPLSPNFKAHEYVVKAIIFYFVVSALREPLL